ncbi:hypothetical protein sortkaff_26 [Escherichia phage sortkaff]|nr:hypothetical protein sortkaff_26 [Escherichia phage sortkaff]
MGKVTAEIIGWTDAQDAELIRLAGTMPREELAKKIGRNFRQMQVRASELGVSLAFNRTYTEWTTGEDSRLLRFLEHELTEADLDELVISTGRGVVVPDELTHAHVANWLGKTVPSLRGRIMKFKREGKFK